MQDLTGRVYAWDKPIPPEIVPVFLDRLADSTPRSGMIRACMIRGWGSVMRPNGLTRPLFRWRKI